MNLALEMTGLRFENRPCAIGGLQEKEGPHTMGWPTLAGAPVVFAGPVHWTENMTKTELNPTAKDRTTSCSCPQLGSVQLPVAMFSEIFKNRKRPVFCHATCRT